MGTALQQWRLINVGMLFIGYGLYFLNRKSFVFLLPEIINSEQELTNNDLGAITSSITLAYAASKFAGGVISDHVSPRAMFASGLFATGALCLQLSVSRSATSFASVSFLLGVFQGCGWPAVSKILKQWYPPSEIGMRWCMVSSASNLAGTVGPLGLAALSLSFGWQGSMQFCGSGAIVMAVIAGFVLRSSPADVGLPPLQASVGESSNNPSEEGRGKSDSAVSNLRAILSSPALWVISFLFLIANFLVTGVTDWGQLYLIQEKGLGHTTGSSFTSAYSLGAMVGSITSGYITDKLVAKYGHRARGTPRYPWLLMMFAMNLLAIHVLWNYIDAGSYQEVILLVGLCLGVSQYSCVTLLGIIATESSPLHLSGTAHAFAALAANVGAVVAGFPLTYIAERHSWSHTLYCMEVASFLSILAMLLMRRMSMKIGYQSVKKTR